jgi:peptidoglycan/LPS O-acetylase OafA/YrhL
VSARPGRLARALSWSPLRGLGTISYALYAVHQPVAVLVRKVLSPGWSAPVALVLSVALATASWHLYEKRWLRLRRHFVWSPGAPVVDDGAAAPGTGGG